MGGGGGGGFYQEKLQREGCKIDIKGAKEAKPLVLASLLIFSRGANMFRGGGGGEANAPPPKWNLESGRAGILIGASLHSVAM